jgi:hypothetical protein
MSEFHTPCTNKYWHGNSNITLQTTPFNGTSYPLGRLLTAVNSYSLDNNHDNIIIIIYNIKIL